MYLFYVFNGCEWEFFDSVKWEQFDYITLSVVVSTAASYIGDSELNCISYSRFLHDMIHYRQFVITHLSIYYIDMPG